MKISTICFPVQDGKIFLANKKRGFGAGFLNGYGGKQKPEDTSIEDTAIREMEEEGGIVASSENLEKVAVIDFFEGDIHIFECHVFFCRKWQGEFHETEEMDAPQPYNVLSPPYDRMWDGDRVWLPLVCSGKKIRAISKYNRSGTKQQSFEYKPLYMRGKFVVVTGPSASGKNRLVDVLLQKIPDSARLVTVTTRAPRLQERNEIDYYFISIQEFEKRLREGEFFEYAEVYGNLYGSSKIILESLLNRFKFVFAIIDVQGAKTLKEKIPESLVLFLRPGSIEDIARRLRDERMGVPKEEIEKRIITASQEMSISSHFDHVVNNQEGHFDETVTYALDILGNY